MSGLGRASLAKVVNHVSSLGFRRRLYLIMSPQSSIAMAKYDMNTHVSDLTEADLGTLVKTYCIPLDLHPCLLDPDLTMDHLPNDAKGLNKVVSFEIVCRDLGIAPTVTLFQVRAGLARAGSSLMSVTLGCWCSGVGGRFGFVNPCLLDPDLTMDHLPNDAKDNRAIPDYLTWRHSHSCIFDDLPTDGYDRNDVTRLCARLIKLREINEAVLVRSGLSSVWFNQKRDPVFRMKNDNSEMSIYDFMTLSTWENAKGTPILLPTLDEIAAAQPYPKLAKKSKAPIKRKVVAPLVGPFEPDQPKKKRIDLFMDDYCTFLEGTLDGNEGTSSRAASAPPCDLVRDLVLLLMLFVLLLLVMPLFRKVSAFVAGSSGKAGADVIRRQLDPMDVLARSARVRDQDYDQILEDDFATASLGEEIDLTLFPIAPGPYVMSYLYVDVKGGVSPEYTSQEWDGPHALEDNILCKEIFKDLDVCRGALDQTITPAELKRTESLSQVHLSNRMNVLTALLVSHGVEMNSRYAALAASNARLRDKVKRKVGYLSELRSKVSILEKKLKKEVRKLKAQLAEAKVVAARSSDELARTDAKLSDQALIVRDLQNVLSHERSKSHEYRDAATAAEHRFNDFMSEVARFASSGIECLVRKFMSNDEFNAALARVLTFSITSEVGRGLRMGRIDAQFEEASQNVSTFFLGAETEFNKAVVDLLSAKFHFLAKITEVSKASLIIAISLRSSSRFRFSLNSTSFSLSVPRVVHLVGMPISAGMTASMAYARLNRVSPLLVLGIVLWAYSTFGSSSTQPAPSWCNLVLIPCMMLRLARSTALFACGCYTDVEMSFISKPSA
ncbi:hypothetical protein Tco_0331500 [Tanacetum coccineum]